MTPKRVLMPTYHGNRKRNRCLRTQNSWLTAKTKHTPPERSFDLLRPFAVRYTLWVGICDPHVSFAVKAWHKDPPLQQKGQIPIILLGLPLDARGTVVDALHCGIPKKSTAALVATNEGLLVKRDPRAPKH